MIKTNKNKINKRKNNGVLKQERKAQKKRFIFKRKNLKKYRYQIITYLQSARKPRPKFRFLGYGSKGRYKTYVPYWSKLPFGKIRAKIKRKNILEIKKKLTKFYNVIKFYNKTKKRKKIKLQQKKSKIKNNTVKKKIIIKRLSFYKRLQKIRKKRITIQKRLENLKKIRKSKREKRKNNKFFNNRFNNKINYKRKNVKKKKSIRLKKLRRRKKIKNKLQKKFAKNIIIKFLKRRYKKFRVNTRIYFFLKNVNSLSMRSIFKRIEDIKKQRQNLINVKLKQILLKKRKQKRVKKEGKNFVLISKVKVYKTNTKKKETNLFLFKKILRYLQLLQKSKKNKKLKVYVKNEKKRLGFKDKTKKIWKHISRGFFKTLVNPYNTSKSLIKHYKMQVHKLQKTEFKFQIQRQRNSLNIINFILAKKRKKLIDIKRMSNKIAFVKNINNSLKTAVIFKNLIESNTNEIYQRKNEQIQAILKAKEELPINIVVANIPEKTIKQQYKLQILKNYYIKNRLSITGLKIKKKNIKKLVKSLPDAESLPLSLRVQWKFIEQSRKGKKEGKQQQQISSKQNCKNKKKQNKLLNIKSNKKIRKKKVSNKAFELLKKNIKIAKNVYIKKLIKKLVRKRRSLKYKVGLFSLRRLKGGMLSKQWKTVLYKHLREPSNIVRITNRIYLLKNKKIKKNKITNVSNLKKKPKKINWLKKKKKKKKKKREYQKTIKKGGKKSKKKKVRKKRGKINIEKRRRLRKISYFIRPRIITQRGLLDYAKHCNDRGILFHRFNVGGENKKIRLKLKVFTKEKKKRLLKSLLLKYFNNKNTQKIINDLKKIKINKYINKLQKYYLNTNYVNFIKEYIKTFYIILTNKQLVKVSLENSVLQSILKKTKIDNKRLTLLAGYLGKKNKNSLERKKKSKQRKKKTLKNLLNITSALSLKVVSHWKLNQVDRLELERVRKEYIKGAKYIYKGNKLKIKQSKFISRKILKAHNKAKKKGMKIKKNIIKASYYYYFKKLRYDRILLDKLNYKNRNFRISNKKKIKLSKFLLFLLMRVYFKRHCLKRTNMRLGIKRIKKASKKRKIKKKIKIIGRKLKGLTKNVRRKSKKYIGAIKKTVLIKVLIKVLRSLLVSNIKTRKEKQRRQMIKEIIKIFLYPLLINKRQIQKVRLRKKNKIYLVMAQIFLYNMKQIVNSANYSINFFGLIGSNITAAYVMRRLMERLETCKGSGLWFITKAMKKLMNSKHVVGFKMKFSGRLTGNSMAQQSIMKRGIIGNSNMNVYIDYAQENIIRKHGKCGLKLWIVRNLLTYMPYKYVYTYNFKK